jgi:hypothetical protein
MTVRAIDSMSNAALDRLALKRDRLGDLRFKFELLDDLGDEPPQKKWIVKNIIARGETSAWIAPPGGLKSALMAELAFHVAAIEDWHGYKTKWGGSVVYFALERADLVKRRLRAYLLRSDIPSGELSHIAVVSGMVDLMNPATVKDVVATIRAVEEDGMSVGLVIFDTFAKLIAAGGGDENLAKDQGKVFANVQRIKDIVGCHVALVGHTGKDAERGARGSNALLGDVDLMVTISGDLTKTATVTKANDRPEGPLFSFKSEVHEFGTDEEGDPITVNVVAEASNSQSERTTAEPKLSTNQRVMYRLLSDAGAAGLTVEERNELAKENGITTKQRRYE